MASATAKSVIMQLYTHNTLSAIKAEDWDALNAADNPFLSHAFLLALENNACVGHKTGWIPLYITAQDGNTLLGGVPLYIKYHSYGEYIFDWAWANAYQQHGLAYYPKLLIGIPFTPVTGERFLTHSKVENKTKLQMVLIQHCQSIAKTIDASSIHCLFTIPNENRLLQQQGFMHRVGYQFHWKNKNYANFEHFLSTLASRHRKKIKRERQRIKNDGIRLEICPADQVSEEIWHWFHRFYRSNCYSKGGSPYLNFGFFYELSRSLSHNMSLIIARRNGSIIAAALFFHNKTAWYGRYWGCSEYVHSLHFETCYYAAIEHCINNKISTFEAGAQGEHKLARGLLPTMIYSMHQIEHPLFREAIADFLHQEKEHVLHHQTTLNEHSPFKKALNIHREIQQQ